MPGEPRLQSLRRQIAALESAGRPDHGVLPFGDDRIDGCLPGGGLARGMWHTLTGDGLEHLARQAGRTHARLDHGNDADMFARRVRHAHAASPL